MDESAIKIKNELTYAKKRTIKACQAAKIQLDHAQCQRYIYIFINVISLEEHMPRRALSLLLGNAI